MGRNVVVVIGVGGMGEAIARRQGPGNRLLLADFDEATLAAVAERLRGQGHEVVTQAVDVSSASSVTALAEAAAGLGPVTQVVHTAGLSPSRRRPPPSCGWTCSGRRWSSRSSGTSSPPAAPGW